jgi:hypothetical protein
MKTTRNNRRIYTDIKMTGYGHWAVTMPVYGKDFTFTTTNSSAIDDYRDTDSERRMASGYRALRAECMRVWRSRRAR